MSHKSHWDVQRSREWEGDEHRNMSGPGQIISTLPEPLQDGIPRGLLSKKENALFPFIEK